MEKLFSRAFRAKVALAREKQGVCASRVEATRTTLPNAALQLARKVRCVANQLKKRRFGRRPIEGDRANRQIDCNCCSFCNCAFLPSISLARSFACWLAGWLACLCLALHLHLHSHLHPHLLASAWLPLRLQRNSSSGSDNDSKRNAQSKWGRAGASTWFCADASGPIVREREGESFRRAQSLLLRRKTKPNKAKAKLN